jgi:hypothetical protein
MHLDYLRAVSLSQDNRLATDIVHYIYQQHTMSFFNRVLQSEHREQCTKTGLRLSHTMQTFPPRLSSQRYT